MKAAVEMQKTSAIVYDAGRMECPTGDYFDVEFWRSQQAVIAEAIGRGSAWFLETPQGPVVLRQYLRGGWAAKISRQRYLLTTATRSRPFKEFYVLADLFERGLPVPRPVAAFCEFHGLTSSGAILTATIPSAKTLVDVLLSEDLAARSPNGFWERIGRCIRRFHDAGVWHADLNARNILLAADEEVFLIDFDRARFTPGQPVSGQGNLKRLRRSLLKVWPSSDLEQVDYAWNRLMVAYDG
jgi:3-deoxy-D-manno-octulosonic acid kinase